MKILRQEFLEHEGFEYKLFDSLFLYEMGKMYVVAWNGLKTGWFGVKTSNDMTPFDTLEEATKEFERMMKILS